MGTRVIPVPRACARAPTWSDHQRGGPAAAEAVEQRPGFDVGVDEGHLAAQLGQSEPDADEVRFVAHQQCDHVPQFQRPAGSEGAGKPVTPSVHVPVRQSPVLEDYEGFARVPARLVPETVQERGVSSLHASLQGSPVAPESQVEEQILPEEGMNQSLVEEKSQQCS